MSISGLDPDKKFILRWCRDDQDAAKAYYRKATSMDAEVNLLIILNSKKFLKKNMQKSFDFEFCLNSGCRLN